MLVPPRRHNRLLLPRPRGAALLPEPDRRDPARCCLVAAHRRALRQQARPQGLRALVRLALPRPGRPRSRGLRVTGRWLEPGSLRPEGPVGGSQHLVVSELPAGPGGGGVLSGGVGSPLLGGAHLLPASPASLQSQEPGHPSVHRLPRPWGLMGWGPQDPSLMALPPCSLHKVLFTEQPETYYKWDNWPPESDRK